MCTVIEKLITIDNLFDWKVSYVRGSKEFSYLYCKITDFKKKLFLLHHFWNKEWEKERETRYLSNNLNANSNENETKKEKK